MEEQIAIADGAVVGTTFKYEGVFENHVDEKRVNAFMDRVKAIRKWCSGETVFSLLPPLSSGGEATYLRQTSKCGC